MATTYRYVFAPEVPFSDVRETLILALLAGEALHGSAQLRLDGVYRLDPPGRACEIAADTAAGRDLNKMFVNFAGREFGDDAFRVERVEAVQNHEPQEIRA
jgi:hypothetical protein